MIEYSFLQLLWFMLVSVLFAGYFFFEGFDYGSGLMSPFLAKTNNERRLIINTLGPIWDGNQVWLITAGGAVFAAFPHWYATLFSGFYLALFLMLIGLILRVVAIEWRSKKQDVKWTGRWDIILAATSGLIALLWGVAVSNLVFGVPIGPDMEYAGGFFNLLAPWHVLSGLVFVLLFAYHSCLFLDIKTDNKAIQVRIKQIAPKLFIPMLVILVVWLLIAFLKSNMFLSAGGDIKLIPLALTLLAAVALLFSFIMFKKGSSGKAFIGTGLGIGLFTFAVFAGMFPNVMIASNNPDNSLTIANASSTPATLTLMTIVACVLVPIVLAYTIWAYWVFRKKLTEEDLKANLDY